MSWMWLRYADEATACPACASRAIHAVDVLPVSGRVRGRRILLISGCERCGVLFSNPLPSADELRQAYSEDGRWNGSAASQQRLLDMKRRAARQQPKVTQDPPKPRAGDDLLAALEPFVPIESPSRPARVLDFGCGDGKLLDRLQARGWTTFGIEPSKDIAFVRHQRLDTPPQDGSFDLIVLHHVLEHVTNPLELLRQLAGAARQDAVLFVGVPRLDTLPLHRDFHYCLNGRNHLLAFSEQSLQALLAMAGFEHVARLDLPELDRKLTGGQPLRLRLVARRRSSPAPGPQRPLRAAVAALKGFHANGGGDAKLPAFRVPLPVRMRAALMARA